MRTHRAAMLDIERSGAFVAQIGDLVPQFYSLPHCHHSDHDHDDHDHEGFFGIDIHVVPAQANVADATSTTGSSSSPSKFGTSQFQWSGAVSSTALRRSASGIRQLPLTIGSAVEWQWASCASHATRPAAASPLDDAIRIHAICVCRVLGVAVDDARISAAKGARIMLETPCASLPWLWREILISCIARTRSQRGVVG